jgi:hypothetical protein
MSSYKYSNKGDFMSETTKAELIEKITFAIIPIMFSGIVYLVTELSAVNTRLSELDSKIAIVVSPENTPRLNAQGELAREKLRQDLMNEQNESLVRHTENKGVLELLKWRVTELEKHK